jgi:hypothetical protein
MFLASYAALCTLIVAESVLIYAVMQSVARIQQERNLAIRGAWPGSPPDDVPAFEAPFLDGEGELTTADLIGQRSALVFMSPSHREGIPHDIYRWILAGVRRKIDAKRYYFLCASPNRDCNEFARRFQADPDADHSVSVVWDERASIAKSFGITKTPSVVALDAAGCVATTGTGSFHAPARVATRESETDEPQL